MSFRRNSLIFHQDVVQSFTLVDIGASGSLVEPWASLDAAGLLSIIGFEPEEEECRKLNEGRHTYLPYALWKEQGEISFHVGKDVSTSSVHPPNWSLLNEFLPRHSEPRQTTSEVTAWATTLDEALEGREVDFIKIDTQGSEYEILTGAERALAGAVGCTLETWTLEVHRGQSLTHDILQLMHERKYRLLDLQRTAIWQRRGGFRKNRGELVGVDLLYFNREPRDGVKAALIADLWGYRAYAAELLKSAATPQAEELLERMHELDRKTIVRPQSRLGQLADLIVPRLLRVRPSVPDIH